MRQVKRSCAPSDFASSMAIIVLPVPVAWLSLRDGFAFGTRLNQPIASILLMFSQFEDRARRVLWKKVVELQQAGYALQESCKLFLDLLGLVTQLPVGPAENSPATGDQAVLTEEVILVLPHGNEFQIIGNGGDLSRMRHPLPWS